MKRALGAVALATATVVVAAGGAVAWLGLQHTVTIAVDGQQRTVRTFAGSVGGVLHRAGLTVGPHDVLAPEATAPVRDGSVVTLERGRLITLTVDGATRQVWVTGRTVGQALGELGLAVDGSVVSASRSRTVPLSGMALDLRLPKRVTVVADGRSVPVVTTATTVADVLVAASLQLAADDELSVPLSTYPTDGMTLTVTRRSGQDQQVSSPIPFATVSRPDPAAYVGTQRVGTVGVPGVLVTTYRLALVDGKPTARVATGQAVARAPVDQVVLVGAMPKPAPPPPPPPPPVKPTPAPAPSGSVWAGVPAWVVSAAACIRAHESGGNYQAQNPSSSASGAYQMIDPTYQSLAATVGLTNYGKARLAPPSDQDRIFIYAALHGMMGNWAGTGCPGT